jgi:hypothetical protein
MDQSTLSWTYLADANLLIYHLVNLADIMALLRLSKAGVICLKKL